MFDGWWWWWWWWWWWSWRQSWGLQPLLRFLEASSRWGLLAVGLFRNGFWLKSCQLPFCSPKQVNLTFTFRMGGYGSSWSCCIPKVLLPWPTWWLAVPSWTVQMLLLLRRLTRTWRVSRPLPSRHWLVPPQPCCSPAPWRQRLHTPFLPNRTTPTLVSTLERLCAPTATWQANQLSWGFPQAVLPDTYLQDGGWGACQVRQSAASLWLMAPRAQWTLVPSQWCLKDGSWLPRIVFPSHWRRRWRAWPGLLTARSTPDAWRFEKIMLLVKMVWSGYMLNYHSFNMKCFCSLLFIYPIQSFPHRTNRTTQDVVGTASSIPTCSFLFILR